MINFNKYIHLKLLSKCRLFPSPNSFLMLFPVHPLSHPPAPLEAIIFLDFFFSEVSLLWNMESCIIYSKSLSVNMFVIFIYVAACISSLFFLNCGFLNHCKDSEHFVWHIRSPWKVRGWPLASTNPFKKRQDIWRKPDRKVGEFSR